MLPKTGKMTPRCPKQLSGDKYAGESRLPGGEYIGESTSLCTLIKHQNRFTKQTFWWIIDQEVKTPVYQSQGSHDYLVYFAPAGSPSVLITCEYTRETNIQKISESFLGVSNGTRRSCMMKKTRAKNSRDIIPIKGLPLRIWWIFLVWFLVFQGLSRFFSLT
jgi:hypothetical protein